MRTANELSAVHSRDLTIRAMDLFHIAIACETGADEFLTFDEDQANLARALPLCAQFLEVKSTLISHSCTIE